MSDIKVKPIHGTFKVENNFKLKSHASLPLVPNVVCRVTCPCDTGRTYEYVSRSSRHLVARAREYLNLNNGRTRAITYHLQQCKSFSRSEVHHLSFTLSKKCLSEYNTKIFETLLTNKSKPFLNKQLSENGCSFLKIF